MENPDGSLFVPAKCHCGKRCEHSFFRLGCLGNHPACIACFSKISASRGYNPNLKCLHCNEPVNTWDVLEVRVTITKKFKKARRSTRSASAKNDSSSSSSTITEITVAKEIVIASDSIPEPRLEFEPTQYHHNLGYDMRVNAVVLAATYPEIIGDNSMMRTGRVKTLSVVMPSSSFDVDDTLSDSEKSKIEAIFRLLHTQIIGDLNDQVLNGIEQFGTPTGKTVDEVITEESSILRRCIHALATGSRLEDSIQKNGPSFESQRGASFAASDIIRSLQQPRIGALKTIIGGQLVASPIPRGFQRILNKFGIAPSNQHNRIKELRASFETLQQSLGDEIDPHDLWMILYDNIGFRKCGNRPGWWQFVALQLLCVKRDELKSKGFYDIAHAPRDDGKIWDNVKSTVSFQEVLGTHDADINSLAKTVLTPIDVLLDMESKGQLPTTKECFDLCKADSFEWPFSVTDTLGKRLVEKEGATPLSTTQVYVNNNQAPPQRTQTNYDANNVMVDRPIELDLNSKEAVESLMEYGLQLLKKVVGAEVRDEEWAGVEKIMNEYGVALLGDGNPTYMMNNLLREKDDVYGGKIRSFFGGFHLMLELHRKRGDLFAKAHLEDFFSSWRTSEGQLKWVMNPGDPNQINAELVMYVLGIYVSAMRSLLKLRRDAQGPEADLSVSATDVVDHMFERAKSYPIVFAILIEVRYAEVIFMLQQSESTSNIDQYISAMKYLAPMFTCAHATKYVPMVADFLVHWFCKSTFEKKVYTEFVFTRKTKNGSTIFPDRFVEWMIRDLRMWCGNSATIHTANILETCALGLNTRKQKRAFSANEAKSAVARGNDEDEEEQASIRIDRVFCEVLIFCIESNLFGPGPPKHILKGPAKDFGLQMSRGLFDYEEGEFTGISDKLKAPLNVNTLRIRSEGVQRLGEYFDVHYVKNDDEESSRSGDGVNLSTINPLASDEDQKDNNELQRCATVDLEVLDKCYTVSELKEEIIYLNSVSLDLELDIVPTRSGQSKKHFLYHVAVTREKISEKDREWKKRRTEEIKLRISRRNESEQHSLSTIIGEEINDQFFNLEGTEKECMSSKKHIFRGTVADDGFNDDDDDNDDDEVLNTRPRVVHTERQSMGLTK